MRRIISLVIGMMIVSAMAAQVTVVRNGRAVGRIVCEGDTVAAEVLQRFVGEVTGVKVPIVYNVKAKKGDVVIEGETDGFRLVTENGVLRVIGGMHGVVYMLEHYVGVHYLASHCYTIDKTLRDLTFPEMDLTVTPAFAYRQTQSYSIEEDPLFKMWFGWKWPTEQFIANMWVHTFNQILPSDRFGKEHPEYYSLLNGVRHPGNHSQWCLSNPAVFEACCHQLDSIFAEHPDLHTISISQNDGNDTYCQCDECKKIYEEEGSVSGAYIRFLNKLAARYPDKEFSTLAYLFTCEPPKVTKPLPNVNIMLCDIDSKREVPLTDNASGQWFVKQMEGWSKISNNIYVWDYGINFDNQVSPFPNFHTLQPNIQLFRDNHTTMHFSQNNAIRGTDFAELRTYILGNLMWNPDCDVDSVTEVFMERYYGSAARYIRKYQLIMEGALLASHKELWIYDSPITHKDGFLSPQLIKMYDELFDKALEAVEGDSVRTAHVRMTRLSLMYSKLEIARTIPRKTEHAPSLQGDGGEKWMSDSLLEEELTRFEEWTKMYGVKYINERNNTPQDYCALYRRRYMPAEVPSKALGAKIIYLDVPGLKVRGAYDVSPLGAPDAGYQPKAYAGALTDGLYGGTTFVESWVGWLGRDADFIVDLGRDTDFTKVEIDFLHQLGAWIMLPRGGYYQIAKDGADAVKSAEKTTWENVGDQTVWSNFGRFSFEEDRDPMVKFVPGTVEVPEGVRARYIRVHIDGLGFCPDWHYGIGRAGWFFLDEINVY